MEPGRNTLRTSYPLTTYEIRRRAFCSAPFSFGNLVSLMKFSNGILFRFSITRKSERSLSNRSFGFHSIWCVLDNLNTITNLSNQGKSFGFGFLDQTAGFQISSTLGTWLMD